MKKYKGLYRLLNVTMACSLAVSLSLYPVQAEEAATQAQEETAAKEAETAAQSAPKETQAPVQAEATAEETEAAAKAEEEKQTSGAEAGNTSATEGAQESSVAASEKDKAAAGAEHASEEMTSGENSDHTGTGTEKGSETGTEASGQDASDKEKDTEAGTTEAESDSEKSSEADDKKKDENTKKDQAGETDPALTQSLSFTVRTKDGTALPASAVPAPAQITCQGTAHPVDYADGIFQVTVPKGTDALQLSVQKAGKDCGTGLADLLFFARWGGYFTESESKWQLCPYLLDGDTALYSAAQVSGVGVYPLQLQDGTCTLPLEKFTFKGSEMSVEQRTVYGIADEDGMYAEIALGVLGADGTMGVRAVLLVKFADDEKACTDTNGQKKSDGNVKDSSQQKTDASTEENGEDKDNQGHNIEESEDESELGSELESETEFEPETETELSTEASSEVTSGITLYASPAQISDAYTSTGQELAGSAKQSIPSIGSINGEWQILGLARSGQEVDASVYSQYKANVIQEVKEKKGILHEKKYTEYSRVILALTALGEDVTNVGGYNLLEPLSDFDQTVWQGVNGAMFALIAFDSHNYEIPTAAAGKTQTTRQNLIQYILDHRTPDGGWAMTGSVADPDLTGMGIQALSPYYDSNAQVKAAVDAALQRLSDLQLSDGTYASGGSSTSESCSQVIVALSSLGIDPNTDSRFIKNGKSVVDGLLSFSVAGGGFKHLSSGTMNQMATEQGYYALTAYERYKNGQNRLYDMTDVAVKSDYDKTEEVQRLIKALPAVSKMTYENVSSVHAVISLYNSLNETQKALVPSEEKAALQQASAKADELEVSHVKELISAIGQVTLDKDKQITEANTAYNSLSEELKAKVGNYRVLEKALKELQKLKAGVSSGSGSGTGNDNTTKKPSGSTKSVNLSSGKRGGTTASKSGGSTSTKAGSTSAKKEGESETDAEGKVIQREAGKRTGGTTAVNAETATAGTVWTVAARKVTSEIADVLHGTKELKRLPSSADDYSQDQIAALTDTYQAYAALSEEEQKAVQESPRYPKFEKALESLGTRYHYDESTGTDLRDNADDALPWYVQLSVRPQLLTEEQEQKIREVLGEKSEIFSMSEIDFVNTLDGEGWEPEQLIKVKLPMVDLGDYETAVIVHRKEDGSLEFLDGKISGSDIVFQASEFSEYGIAGMMGDTASLLDASGKESRKVPVWPFAAGGGAAAFGLLVLVLVRRAEKKHEP